MKINSIFSSLKLMHKALLIGQILFIAVMAFLVYKKIVLPPLVEHDKILQVIALIFSALAIFVGKSIFKKKLMAISDAGSMDAKTKLSQYRSICVQQWSFLEAACMLNGIFLMLTGNFAYLALAVLLMLYFAMLIPMKDKIAAQLHVQISEVDEL